VEANAASTAAMVLGAAAVEWLEALCLPARLVDLDGGVTLTDRWPVPGGGRREGARRRAKTVVAS